MSLRPVHPLVVDARLTAATGLAFGTIGLAEVVFFPSFTVYLISLGVLVLGLLAFRRWQRRAIDPTASKPARAAVAPGAIGVVSLLLYVVIVGVLHTHTFKVHAIAYEHRLRRDTAARTAAGNKIDRAIRKDDRRTKHLDARLKRARDRLRKIDRAYKASPTKTRLRQMQATIASLTPVVRELNALNLDGQRRAIQGIHLVERPGPQAPDATSFPPWFSGLTGLFTSLAQILVALILALIFSLRASSSVTPVLRSAMPLALLGLVASLIGNAPALPGNWQAVLLSYAIAGVATSTTGIGLIAMGLLGSDDSNANAAQ